MEIEGDHELSGGRKAKAARTEKLPPAVEGRAEGVSSPSAPDKVKALFTGAVMKPELAPKSTLQGEGNLCPQSGLSPPGVNMNTPWWEGAGAPHPSQKSRETDRQEGRREAPVGTPQFPPPSEGAGRRRTPRAPLCRGGR